MSEECAAALLRAFRAYAGITQQDLANRLGKSVTTVERWERGDAATVGKTEARRRGLVEEVGRACEVPPGPLAPTEALDRVEMRLARIEQLLSRPGGRAKRDTPGSPDMKSTLAAIAAHPLRIACFMVLAERTASPNELRDLLGTRLDDVNQHVRALRDLGAIEPVRKGDRSVHYYRAIELPIVSDEEWIDLSVEQRESISRDILQRCVTDMAGAQEAGTFDSRPTRALIRNPKLLLDEEGWEEMNELYTEVHHRQFEIQARSDARQADRQAVGAEDERIPVCAIAMFFERAPAAFL